jgi:uracil-DNA glycosylase
MAAAGLLLERQTLTGLRKALEGCRACPSWKDMTQTVFAKGLCLAEPIP